MELLDQLKVEHLEGDQRQLAETIGIEAYIKLIRMYSGSAVYVPTIDNITLQLRDKLICEEYNGYNAFELAKKYGLSERWILNITGDIREQARRKPIDGQVSMFGG